MKTATWDPVRKILLIWMSADRWGLMYDIKSHDEALDQTSTIGFSQELDTGDVTEMLVTGQM